MKNMASISLVFAEKVGHGWNEAAGSDCEAYQRRFLCRQASGAYHTAKSFWILRKNKCFNDCIILARNLLERIANSICAAKSPAQAVELIAHETTEKIRLLKKWKLPPAGSAKLQQTITQDEQFLAKLLGLIQKSKAPDWSFFQRFQKPGMEGFYRSGYFNFSRYTHAGYEMPPGRREKPLGPGDFIALVAPVITGALYHRLDCPCCKPGKCEVHDESVALIKAFSSSSLGNKRRGTTDRIGV
ncbi:MAG: DUF5677 domain-containing protein [Limisphaerales bacterium]|jgi:hypothetical protein